MSCFFDDLTEANRYYPITPFLYITIPHPPNLYNKKMKNIFLPKKRTNRHTIVVKSHKNKALFPPQIYAKCRKPLKFYKIYKKPLIFSLRYIILDYSKSQSQICFKKFIIRYHEQRCSKKNIIFFWNIFFVSARYYSAQNECYDTY